MPKNYNRRNVSLATIGLISQAITEVRKEPNREDRLFHFFELRNALELALVQEIVGDGIIGVVERLLGAQEEQQDTKA